MGDPVSPSFPAEKCVMQAAGSSPFSQPSSCCSSFAEGSNESDFCGVAGGVFVNLHAASLPVPALPHLLENRGRKGVGKHRGKYVTQPNVVPELIYSELNPLLPCSVAR